MESIIENKKNDVNQTISDSLEQFQDEMKDKFAEKLQDMVMELETELHESIDKELDDTEKQIKEEKDNEKPASIKEFIVDTEKYKSIIKSITHKEITVVAHFEIEENNKKKYSYAVLFKRYPGDQEIIWPVIDETIKAERLNMKMEGKP